MQAGEPNRIPADIPMAKPVVPIAKPVEMNAVFVNQAVSIRGIGHMIVSWVIFFVFFALAAGIMIALSGGAPASSLGQWAQIILCVIIANVLQALLPWIQRIRTRRRVRDIFSQNPEMPLEQLAAMVQAKRCRLSGYAGTKEIIRLLVEAEREDETARFCLPSQMHSVSPLHVEFEPRLLDETDSSFRELADSTTPEGWTQKRFANKDNIPVRKLLRNMHLKEGKLTLAFFIILWIFAFREVLAVGTITIRLMIWTILIVVSLFSPATGGSFSNKWHIVPAGLFVLLGANPDKLKWYAFDRRESILAVHQLTRHKWIVFVADAAMSLETKATTEEVHMLLRAWLSPLPAIPSERLAALASA